MTTASTVQRYLDGHGIAYDMLSHRPTMSSLDTAQAAHVSGNKLAKAVVLKTNAGYLVAVVPASHHLQWPALHGCLGQVLALATEEEITWLFPDCTLGAVPPFGDAYGIETVVDDSIAEQSDIYFEGGDHGTLLHVAGPAFRTLMAQAKHGRFSSHH